MNSKRSYVRRSEEDRISALQARIEELKKKVEEKQRPDLGLVHEVPKLQKRLRAFAQLAANNGRDDIANSTVAFLAGLDRMIDNVDAIKRRTRAEGSGKSPA